MKKIFSFLLLILSTTFVIAQGKVSFQAEIANRNSDTLRILKYNGDHELKIIKNFVSKNGSFKDSLNVEKGFFVIYDGVQMTNVFLKNGFDLKLKMNARDFHDNVYSGTGSIENNYIQKIMISDIYSFDEENLKLNEVAFLSLINKEKKENLKNLENIDFDSDFVEQEKKEIEKTYFQLKKNYSENLKNKKLNNLVSQSFDYENYAGGKTKLEDLRGKYVYIDVWATWCGPCRAEIPYLKKIEEKYENKNIAFVSISVDEIKDHEKWIKFIKNKKLGGIQLFSDNNWMSEFIRYFGIYSIPRFILIDPSGNVVSSDAPRPSDFELKDILDKLLN